MKFARKGLGLAVDGPQGRRRAQGSAFGTIGVASNLAACTLDQQARTSAGRAGAFPTATPPSVLRNQRLRFAILAANRQGEAAIPPGGDGAADLGAIRRNGLPPSAHPEAPSPRGAR